MPFKLHVISDTYYLPNEPEEAYDIPPEADIVILNGNIAKGWIKRGFMYAYSLANKHPDVQFVYNLGEGELYYLQVNKYDYEVEDNILIRMNNDVTWPKNLHWKHPKDPNGMLIELRSGYTVDVFTAYGFPKIHKYEGDWENTNWFQNYAVSTLMVHKENLLEYKDKPTDTSEVAHGHTPIWATPEWINEQHVTEHQLVKNWELNLKHCPILVTHLNPYNDPRFANCTTSPYRIHLHNGTWVTAMSRVKGVNFLGAKLYSNPGRGESIRSECIEIY